MINVFFWDREAHGIVLVSVCSPVNCIARHVLSIGIIIVNNIRHGQLELLVCCCRRRTSSPQPELHEASTEIDEWQRPFFP